MSHHAFPLPKIGLKGLSRTTAMVIQQNPTKAAAEEVAGEGWRGLLYLVRPDGSLKRSLLNTARFYPTRFEALDAIDQIVATVKAMNFAHVDRWKAPELEIPE